jgi:hypothetical protein
MTTTPTYSRKRKTGILPYQRAVYRQLSFPRSLQVTYQLLANYAIDAATRAHRLVTRWKPEQKYTGRAGSIPGFEEARMAFQDAVVDYAMPSAERVQLLHHVLRDRAYQYFHSHILAQSITEAYKLMEDQFCSAASQHSTKTLLYALDVLSIWLEKGLSKKESLDHVYEEIARLSSQCPPEFRSEANCVEFLKKALRDGQWALSTLQSYMITRMNFTTFILACLRQLCFTKN